jgi:hypothetical protein
MAKQFASKQPTASTREQKGKGLESTAPAPLPTPTATAQKATQEHKGNPPQSTQPPTRTATAPKATREQKGKAPEFTPLPPPPAPPTTAQKSQEEKATPEEKVSTTHSIRTRLLTSASSSLLGGRKLFIGLSIVFPMLRLQSNVCNRSAANPPWRRRRLQRRTQTGPLLSERLKKRTTAGQLPPNQMDQKRPHIQHTGPAVTIERLWHAQGRIHDLFAEHGLSMHSVSTAPPVSMHTYRSQGAPAVR